MSAVLYVMSYITSLHDPKLSTLLNVSHIHPAAAAGTTNQNLQVSILFPPNWLIPAQPYSDVSSALQLPSRLAASHQPQLI